MKKLLFFLLICVGLVLADSPHNIPRGPVIVSEVNISATYQNGVANVFNAYTVPVSGLYRISSYVEEFPVTNTDNWQLIFIWTDDTGNVRSNGTFPSNVYGTATGTVFAVAGSNIQIQVSTANNSSQFNLFATVEKL